MGAGWAGNERGQRMLEIYTSTIRYGGPDRLDVTVKSAGELGRAFAPAWDIVRGYQEGRISEEEYARRYRRMMLGSFKTNRAAWERVAAMDRVVLCCYCRPGAFCHRRLLAEYLVRAAQALGKEAAYRGEIAQ